MKFCNNPFKKVHLDPGGGVRVCSWTDESIGNVLKEDFKEIWHGEKANKIRESIMDGSYKYCRAISCPYLENDSLPDIDGEELEREKIPTEVPVSYSVACDFTCNHSCPSCRDEVFCGSKEYKENLEKELDIILPYLQKAENIVTCGNGDIFSSKQMMDMLEKLKPENKDCKIQFETNGALFDEKRWDRIKHLGEYELLVTITPNSFEEHTFKYLNGGHDSLKEVLHNLAFIKELKSKGMVNEIEISMVMQDRNFWELPDFARRCIEEFDADRVVVKPLYKWFNLSEDNYWHKDVLNPLHPYHAEYLEMIKDPYLQNNDKVFFWGANNLHPAQKHPAYRYKEQLDIISRLVDCKNLNVRLKKYFENLNVSKLYIYGDMEISSIIYNILSEAIEIEAFIARDIKRKQICGLDVISVCDYTCKPDDVILVLNYPFFANIKRDFDFAGFTGRLIRLDDLVDTVLEQ